jgi:hypothetical protein
MIDLKDKFISLLTDLKIVGLNVKLFDVMTREKTRLYMMNVNLRIQCEVGTLLSLNSSKQRQGEKEVPNFHWKNQSLARRCWC